MPLNMTQNRYLIFLKEQKYLVKHILLNGQKSIPQYYSKKIVKLLQDYNEYYLLRHVDLDLYDMPFLSVLQMVMPPTLL